MAQKVKIIFGVFRFGQWSRKTQDEMLSLLETHNVKDLDTAAGYVSALDLASPSVRSLLMSL